MESAVPAAESRVASNRSTLIVIGVLLLISFLSARQLGSGVAPSAPGSRVLLYLSIAFGEWALVYAVWKGVRARGHSLRELIGRADSGLRAWALDLAIAALFFGVATAVLYGLKHLLAIEPPARVAAMLPRGPAETAAFVLLALSAGFCEEIVFRGYLRRQLAALAGSRWLGNLGQAVIFGLSHGYQGWKSMLAIAVYGLLFGLLAQLRGSLRPGIIAHAWQDIFSGVLFPGP